MTAISKQPPAYIAQLNTQDIVALTKADFKSLKPAQLAAFTSEQIGVIEDEDLLVLTGKQVAAFNSEALAGESQEIYDRLKLLKANQVGALTTEQIAAMGTAHIGSFDAHDFKILKTSQLKAMNSSVVASLNSEQLSAITIKNIKNLDIKFISSITALNISALSKNQLLTLSGNQLSNFTTEQVHALTTEQASYLTAKQINALSATNIKALETEDFASINAKQFAKFSVAVMAALTTDEVTALTTTQISRLSAKQINALSNDQIHALENIDISAIRISEISKISTNTIIELNSSQIASLNSRQIQQLKVEHLNALATKSTVSPLGENEIFKAASEIIKINSISYNKMGRPALSELTNGEIVISWQGTDDAGSGWTMHSQIFDKSLNQNGPAIAINQLGPNNLTYLQANRVVTTPLQDGGYFIAWRAMDTSSWPAKVSTYGQAYDSDLTARGEIQKVTGWSDTKNLAIATFENGNILIAYYSKWSLDQVGAKILDPDGIELAKVFYETNSGDSVAASNIAAATLDNGGFLIAYEDGNSGSTQAFLRRYSSNYSNDIEYSIHINAEIPGTYQAGPSIAVLNNGNYVVASSVRKSSNRTVGDIYAQIYSQDGAILKHQFQINSPSQISYTQSGVNLTSLSDGGFIATWNSQDESGSITDIHAQRYTASGEPMGDEIKVGTSQWSYKDFKEISPTTLQLSDGSLLISWYGYDPDGESMDIFAQRFMTGLESETGTPNLLNFVGFADVSNKKLSQLSSASFGNLTNTQISELNSKQIKSITYNQINALNQEKFESISTIQISQFTAKQLNGFTNESVGYLTTSLTRSINSKELNKLSTNFISQLNSDQIDALESNQLKSLKSSQLNTFSPDEVGVLDGAQIGAIKTAEFKRLSTDFLAAMSADQIASINLQQIQALTAQQLSALSEEQVNAFTDLQLAKFSKKQRLALGL